MNNGNGCGVSWVRAIKITPVAAIGSGGRDRLTLPELPCQAQFAGAGTQLAGASVVVARCELSLARSLGHATPSVCRRPRARTGTGAVLIALGWIRCGRPRRPSAGLFPSLGSA